jgi:hypothetical protein
MATIESGPQLQASNGYPQTAQATVCDQAPRAGPLHRNTPLATTQIFHQLNVGWNADPNVPEPKVTRAGHDVLLEFNVSPFQFQNFRLWEQGVLRFLDCERHTVTDINDHGWCLGQCRYSNIAPEWGEFYEITGEDLLRDQASGWVDVGGKPNDGRHFLFYFRDETFECFARNWTIEPTDANALYRERTAGHVRV